MRLCGRGSKKTAPSGKNRKALCLQTAAADLGAVPGLLVEDVPFHQGLPQGLRAVSDFDYEFSMALANRKLNAQVDTAFLMTSAEYMYLSSSMVKDIALHGGKITDFVPEEIENEIYRRVRKDG